MCCNLRNISEEARITYFLGMNFNMDYIPRFRINVDCKRGVSLRRSDFVDVDFIPFRRYNIFLFDKLSFVKIR